MECIKKSDWSRVWNLKKIIDVGIITKKSKFRAMEITV